MTKEEAIERVARALCVAEYADPDVLVISGVPLLTARGSYVALPSANAHPVWHDYSHLAKAAIDAVEQLPPDYLEMLIS